MGDFLPMKDFTGNLLFSRADRYYPNKMLMIFRFCNHKTFCDLLLN